MPSPHPPPPPPPPPPLHTDFPPARPVGARREEIMAALARHQVVIVCGATGSGKTTQLPKIALALGRGRCNAKPGADGQGRGQLIGHTQPRRLAASSAGKRIAHHLQTAPLLRAYDTIILDEAHERSMNIDFLLGYLRQILPRRPDLKLVIASATIDADRFARHFASGDALTCAPVIEVSGRSFPVEL